MNHSTRDDLQQVLSSLEHKHQDALPLEIISRQTPSLEDAIKHKQKYRITVKSDLDSFDKIFATISGRPPSQQNNKTPILPQSLIYPHHHAIDMPRPSHSHPESHWSGDIHTKLMSFELSLKDEARIFQDQARQAKIKERALKVLQLVAASSVIFINTSQLDSSVMKMVNIGLSVFNGFLAGLDGIFKFDKKAYQYAETSITLDGLARSIQSQLLLEENQRQHPVGLLLFLESTREKVLQKLVEK